LVPKALSLYSDCDLQEKPEGNGREVLTVIKYVTSSGIKDKCNILPYPLCMQEHHRELKLQEEIFQLNTRKQLSKKFAFWRSGEKLFICTKQPKPDNLSRASHFNHSRCFSPRK